jgi:hypothetical protein
MNIAAPRLSVPALLLGLPVLRRSARRLLPFTRSVVAGFSGGMRGYHSSGFFGLAHFVAGSGAAWAASMPNPSFNRTGNGLRRCLPSLALGAG